MKKPTAAYELKKTKARTNKHILAVMVDNEPGILARVVGLFSGRGYNIESLAVTTVSENEAISRITIVTSGTDMVVYQIKTQLSRLVPVYEVYDLTLEGAHVEKEIILLKICADGDNRIESLRMADIFGAKVVDTTRQSYIFQLSGSPSKCDAFIALMRELSDGDMELVRSGVISIARGASLIKS